MSSLCIKKYEGKNNDTIIKVKSNTNSSRTPCCEENVVLKVDISVKNIFKSNLLLSLKSSQNAKKDASCHFCNSTSFENELEDSKSGCNDSDVSCDNESDTSNTAHELENPIEKSEPEESSSSDHDVSFISTNYK